jgi:hypothetical protein
MFNNLWNSIKKWLTDPLDKQKAVIYITTCDGKLYQKDVSFTQNGLYLWEAADHFYDRFLTKFCKEKVLYIDGIAVLWYDAKTICMKYDYISYLDGKIKTSTISGKW